VAGRKDEETSAHPEEKFDTHAGKRNPGAPITRCAIGDLELSTSRLSWVRRESHAQFCGEGVVVILPPYPTT
jgi:hypothetical protein